MSAKICSIEGCEKPVKSRGWCDMHWTRWRRHGDPLTEPMRRENVCGRKFVDYGYARQPDGEGGRRFEHVLIAEAVLGRPLPNGAEVHHVNGDGSDNRPGNLVICPSRSYHRLLHKRQRALDMCGHADWQKCEICGEYDDPANMYIRSRGGGFHRECNRELKRARTHNRGGVKNV